MEIGKNWQGPAKDNWDSPSKSVFQWNATCESVANLSSIAIIAGYNWAHVIRGEERIVFITGGWGQWGHNLPLHVSSTPASRPFRSGPLLFVPFLLQNNTKCCEIFLNFSQFPPPLDSRLPPFFLPLPALFSPASRPFFSRLPPFFLPLPALFSPASRPFFSRFPPFFLPFPALFSPASRPFFSRFPPFFLPLPALFSPASRPISPGLPPSCPTPLTDDFKRRHNPSNWYTYMIFNPQFVP